MSFTSIGKVVAHLFFWYGVLQVALALYYGWTSSDVVDSRNALSKQIMGEFGEGMNRVFFGVALGVLCEISSKKNKPDEKA